jgi:hypothetical protein
LDIYNMILALGVKIKVSLLYASYQGLSWGGEVNNWTQRKSVVWIMNWVILTHVITENIVESAVKHHKPKSLTYRALC